MRNVALTRILYTLLLVTLAILAGVRILALAMADRTAGVDPATALQWRSDHPQARLAMAEADLAQGRIRQAQAGARAVLADEPLRSQAFTVLAQAEERLGNQSQAVALHMIAARRSPRDLRAHAWLAQHFLVTGQYAMALEHIEVILRVSPRQAEVLLPQLARLSSDPRFAAALSVQLRSQPRWRTPLLALRPVDGTAGVEALLTALVRTDALSDAEADAWMAALLREGRWERAYAVWVGRLDSPPNVIARVHNGDFEETPRGAGFDWHRPAVAGVSTDFPVRADGDGSAAHVVFRDRAVAQVDLEQPLLLPPGRYRFSARMRARALRSDGGLEWIVTCHGHAEPITASPRMSGSFPWREIRMDVRVPTEGCPGQWLRLRNPAPTALSQVVSGELWIDSVEIRQVDAAGGGAVRALLRLGPQSESPSVRVDLGAGFARADNAQALRAGDRVLVPAGAVAGVEYATDCLRRIVGPDVHTVTTRCPALPAVAAPVDASRMAAQLDVAGAILRHRDPRPPIPAGR